MIVLEINDSELLALDLLVYWFFDFMANDGKSSFTDDSFPCPNLDHVETLQDKVGAAIMESVASSMGTK